MTTSPASSASELRERIGANLEVVRTSHRSRPAVTRTVFASWPSPRRSRARRCARPLRSGCATSERTTSTNSARSATSRPRVSGTFSALCRRTRSPARPTCANVLSGVSRERELTKLASLASTSWLDIQVDFTRRAERNGAPESSVPELVSRARELNLKVRGLMVVAPPEPTWRARRFRRTVELADELGLVERSMGMSEDLEMACELGTTEVRVGRALFGPRTDAGHLA